MGFLLAETQFVHPPCGPKRYLLWLDTFEMVFRFCCGQYCRLLLFAGSEYCAVPNYL